MNATTHVRLSTKPTLRWMAASLLVVLAGACGGKSDSEGNGAMAGSSGTGATAGAAGSSATGGSSGSGGTGAGTGGSSGSGAAAGSAGSSGTAGAAGATHTGECSSDADCPGGTCKPVPNQPGGFWTCVYPAPEPTTVPSSNPSEDECTTSAQCDPGCGCFLVEEVYPGLVEPHNRCQCDQCETDDDCADPDAEVCVPAGAFGLPKNLCVAAECKVDSDCANGTGGRCVAYRDVCSALDPGPLVGKYCHYEEDPCDGDADCSESRCIPSFSGEGFVCNDMPPCLG